MERLPAELMYEVLGQLSTRDMKSTRLASEIFHPVANQLLFRRVYASIHLKDLEVLSAISAHPTIRLAIREVVHIGVYFHYPIVTPEYIDPIDQSLYYGEFQQKDETYDCLDYYNARLQEQEKTRKSGYDLATISAALAEMPNVRSVVLVNQWRNTAPFFRSYPGSTARPFGVPLRIEEGPHAGKPFDYGFEIMCKAVSISGRQIENFDIQYGGHNLNRHDAIVENWGVLPTSFLCTPCDLQHYCNAFRHLRKIRLVIHNAGKQRHILESGNLPEILAAATEMKYMRIVMKNERDGHEYTPEDEVVHNWVDMPLSKVLGTHTWPHLQGVSLIGMRTTSEELVEFVRRHSSTLNFIDLKIMSLEGSWAGAALRLRHLRCPALNLVTCANLLETQKPQPQTRGLRDKLHSREVAKCILGHDYNSSSYWLMR
ncbi:hypothetical protein F4821DRAFT_265184 [Hypoxylon rubiginosum]|uniref:Uncharacterized protein n=1 Tax=Hypoxylon rubiginosum TaxID=110542 RepID=A0ACC0CL82_9PEZI|nr:hypothetical protein F4821DRAFT_265184 [Hypoxylon rubiginosum]